MWRVESLSRDHVPLSPVIDVTAGETAIVWSACVEDVVVKVIDEAGQPVEGASVVWWPPALDDAAHDETLRMLRTTGSDGTADFPRIAGRAAGYFAVSKNGYHPTRSAAEPDDGESSSEERTMVLIRLHRTGADGCTFVLEGQGGPGSDRVRLFALMDDHSDAWMGPPYVFVGEGPIGATITAPTPFRSALRWTVAWEGREYEWTPQAPVPWGEPQRIRLPEGSSGLVVVNGVAPNVGVEVRISGDVPLVVGRGPAVFRSPLSTASDEGGLRKGFRASLPVGAPVKVVVKTTAGQRHESLFTVAEGDWTHEVNLGPIPDERIVELTVHGGLLESLLVSVGAGRDHVRLNVAESDDGRYRVPFPPGSTSIQATSKRGLLAVARRIPCGQDELSSMELRFPETVPAVLEVVTDDGHPVPGVVVQLVPLTSESMAADGPFAARTSKDACWEVRIGNVFRASTDSAGEARFAVPPATYGVTVRDNLALPTLHPGRAIRWPQDMIAVGAGGLETSLVVDDLRRLTVRVAADQLPGWAERWKLTEVGSDRWVKFDGSLARLWIGAAEHRFLLSRQGEETQTEVVVPAGREATEVLVDHP